MLAKAPFPSVWWLHEGHAIRSSELDILRAIPPTGFPQEPEPCEAELSLRRELARRAPPDPRTPLDVKTMHAVRDMARRALKQIDGAAARDLTRALDALTLNAREVPADAEWELVNRMRRIIHLVELRATADIIGNEIELVICAIESLDRFDFRARYLDDPLALASDPGLIVSLGDHTATYTRVHEWLTAHGDEGLLAPGAWSSGGEPLSHHHDGAFDPVPWLDFSEGPPEQLPRPWSELVDCEWGDVIWREAECRWRSWRVIADTSFALDVIAATRRKIDALDIDARRDIAEADEDSAPEDWEEPSEPEDWVGLLVERVERIERDVHAAIEGGLHLVARVVLTPQN